jgi:quercetin dioxygenase-like cupin family protein
LQHLKFSELELEEVNPMLSRQLITGQQMMLARVIAKKGCVVPEHSHFNEQLSYIEKGALRFTIDGKDIVVKAGEVLCIPPNLPHSALALEDTIDIDIFVPPRQDWLDKTDSYLQQANRK